MSAIDSVKLERHRQMGCRIGSPEESWRQFIEVAAPFRPLIAKLTGEMRARFETEIFAKLRKLPDGSVITMPLEIVVGTGMRA